MRSGTWLKAVTMVALFALATGCAETGRVMTADEPSLAGSRTAGADVYNKLIDETLRKLLESSSRNGSPKKVICFVDIENKGAEELAENKAAIFEQIDIIIVESGIYIPVSRRQVDHMFVIRIKSSFTRFQFCGRNFCVWRAFSPVPIGGRF